jgi:hypothetical protein
MKTVVKISAAFLDIHTSIHRYLNLEPILRS